MRIIFFLACFARRHRDNDWMAGHLEVVQRDLFHHHAETLALAFRPGPIQQVLRAVAGGALFQLPDGPSTVSNRDHFLEADLSGGIRTSQE